MGIHYSLRIRDDIQYTDHHDNQGCKNMILRHCVLYKRHLRRKVKAYKEFSVRQGLGQEGEIRILETQNRLESKRHNRISYG